MIDIERTTVNGWKQAVSIIEAQQKALDWCTARLEKCEHEKSEHEKSEQLAREFHEVVLKAQKTGRLYVDSMKKAGAL